MTASRCLAVCRWLTAVSLTAYCLWRGFVAASAYLGSADAYAYLAEWRSAARNAPTGRLALLCNDEKVVAPIDRSRLIAAAWERAPDRLSLVDGAGEPGEADGILSSAWHSPSAGRRLEALGYVVVSTNEYVKTWAKTGAVRPDGRAASSPASLPRELLALLLEFLAMIAVFWFAAGRRRIAWQSSVAAVLVVATLGCVALSHPLLPPNGLGVYGGKAKLWFLCGGLPDGFMASDGGAVLQPAYPPGLTALAYLHFVLSGGCGDRLVQLLVVFAAGLLCLVLTSGARSLRALLPAALFCVSPVAVRLTSGFNAEPFAALLLVLGWRTMRGGRLPAGALIMGLAGIFRPEAGVAAALFAVCGCSFRSNLCMKLVGVVTAAVPTLLWIAICRSLGSGGLADWNIAMMPRLGQVISAALAVLDALWKLAIPAFALLFLVQPARRKACRREVLLAFVPVALLCCAIPLACGFYDAPYANWMIGNTVPRLVWYLLPVPLFAVACPASGCVHPLRAEGRPFVE